MITRLKPSSTLSALLQFPRVAQSRDRGLEQLRDRRQVEDPRADTRCRRAPRGLLQPRERSRIVEAAGDVAARGRAARTVRRLGGARRGRRRRPSRGSRRRRTRCAPLRRWRSARGSWPRARGEPSAGYSLRCARSPLAPITTSATPARRVNLGGHRGFDSWRGRSAGNSAARCRPERPRSTFPLRWPVCIDGWLAIGRPGRGGVMLVRGRRRRRGLSRAGALRSTRFRDHMTVRHRKWPRRLRTLPDTAGAADARAARRPEPEPVLGRRLCRLRFSGNRFWPAAPAFSPVTRSRSPRPLTAHGVGMTDLV